MDLQKNWVRMDNLNSRNLPDIKKLRISKAIEIITLFGIWSFTVCYYYLHGGERFADYTTYVNSTPADYRANYFFEILSWSILAAQNPLVDGIANVDVFYILVHIFSLISIIILSFSGRNGRRSTIIFCFLFFPLLLTTNLRVAPLQICFYYFCLLLERGIISPRSFFILNLCVAPLFHDTGLIVSALAALSMLIGFFSVHFKPNRASALWGKGKFMLVCILAFVTLNAGSTALYLYLRPLGEVMLARSAYFGDTIASTSLKLIYSNFFVAVCLLSLRDTRLHGFRRNFATIIFGFTTLLLAVSPTLGVRLSFFSLSCFLAFRVGLFAWVASSRIVAIAPLLFIGVFFYLDFLLLDI
jgi:hypothetical protein